MNSYTKLGLAIGAGIGVPTMFDYFIRKRRLVQVNKEFHEKDMLARRAHIKVMDDLMHGKYDDKPRGTARSDYEFYLVTKEIPQD